MTLLEEVFVSGEVARLHHDLVDHLVLSDRVLSSIQKW